MGEGLDLSVFLRVRVARGPPAQPKAGRWYWVGELISEGLRISVFVSKALESHGETPARPAPDPICSSLAVWEREQVVLAH